MISITIEGDEAGVVALIEGHIMAFFNQSADMSEPAEYVRLVFNEHTNRIDTQHTVKIPSIYTSGVLYRTEAYATAETPYHALWRSLGELLPPRLYNMLREDFKLKNAAYSKAKYNASKGVKQERFDI